MAVRRIARPLLGAIFVFGGINALRYLEGHTQKAKPVLDPVLDKVPAKVEADTMVRADAMIKIGGGLALGLGVLPRFAAMLLAGSLVPTTFAGHRFWESETPQDRTQQQIHFLKNAGLLGGLLMVAADSDD